MQERQERPRHAHDAPEIDAEQPVEISLSDLLEGTAKRNTGIVDENVDSGMFGRHLPRKSGDRGAVGYIEVMPADTHLVHGELGGRTRERGVVNIGKREVAAAARQ